MSRSSALALALLACVIAALPLADHVSMFTVASPLGMAALAGWCLWRLPSDRARGDTTTPPATARDQDSPPWHHLLQKVLPVWHQHMQSARTQIDDAVTELVGNFASITDQFDAAGFKGASSSTEQHDETASLLSMCESELQQVIALMNQLTHSKGEMNASVQELLQATKDLQSMAQGVAQIASQTNLLAINAAIEAAHAGDSGRGFATIAKEIRSLSQSSAQTASLITQRIARVTAIMNDTSQATAKAAEYEDTAIKRSSGAVGDVLAHMRQLSADAETMRDRGNVIRNDIEQLIVSLQFQDRVNQLMSVVDADMVRLRDQIERQELPPSAEQWLHDLQHHYTMREQRQAPDTSGPTAAPAEPARKVVFF